MHIPWEIIQTVLAALLITIISYSAKKAFVDPGRAQYALLLKHIDECNQIPKVLLMERIDNLHEKVDSLVYEIRELKSKR